jgi:hypothetical protein
MAHRSCRAASGSYSSSCRPSLNNLRSVSSPIAVRLNRRFDFWPGLAPARSPSRMTPSTCPRRAHLRRRRSQRPVGGHLAFAIHQFVPHRLRPRGVDPGRPPLRRNVRRNVYPGIDVALYGNEGRLEFDFVLQPHADPAQIRLAGTELSLDSSGDLRAPGRLLTIDPVVDAWSFRR